jgi:hypothetical protein
MKMSGMIRRRHNTILLELEKYFRRIGKVNAVAAGQFTVFKAV